jgi:ABC-type branched-subunit amino acid transport system ATPase component/predicted MFS family arabinose efflux permease
MAGTELTSLATEIVDQERQDAAGTEHVDGSAAARAIVAPASPTGDARPLREVLGRWGSAPLAVLFSLNLVDELDRIAFTVLAPDIRRTFGISNAALLGLSSLSGVLIVLAAIPFAYLAERRRRTTIAGVAALLWTAFAFLTGAARGVGQLGVARFLSGFGKASVDPVHGSLLADYYPPEARGRVYGLHQAANGVAGLIGPLFAGGVAYLAGGSAGWRWAFLLGAPFSLIAGLAALRLREPVRGGQERGVAVPVAVTPETLAADELGVGVPKVPLGTAFRRLLQIRSLRFIYFGVGVLGFGLVAGPTLLSLHFEESLGIGELGRAVIFTVLAAGLLAGAPVGGVAGDRLFRHHPAWPLFLTGALVVAYTVVTAAALYLPGVLAQVAVLTVALAAVAGTAGTLRQVVAATAPPAMRALSFAMLGVFIFLFGGFFGGIIFGAISDATSPRFALTVLVIPGAIAGALMAYGARFVESDIAMVVEDVKEEERATRRRTEPARNLLEVRNLDFSYGSVQVLFGVDLDVREGEIVALLGTNGAGKSTLLRAVCGLEHPTRGSIRLDGQDVTYLEAEQVLALGLSQMPGGKATFPGLTVEENLRAGCFSFRRDRERVEREIAQVEAWFAVLADRRRQLASTLSGGEQQMLALGKAFLTRPRLLCIDELSLGLAPAVVEQLLGIVREIHARGTTVVIVEQSVNVALALATTAVFMEKGEVRFSGPARELLDRPDLLRSVFLEGAK